MPREFLFDATVDRVPDVFAANAINRDQLLRDLRNERIAEDPQRPRLKQTEYYDDTQPVLRRWVWEVTNTTTGEDLATGRMPTQRLARWRKHKAYCKVLAALSKAGAES